MYTSISFCITLYSIYIPVIFSILLYILLRFFCIALYSLYICVYVFYFIACCMKYDVSLSNSAYFFRGINLRILLIIYWKSIDTYHWTRLRKWWVKSKKNKTYDLQLWKKNWSKKWCISFIIYLFTVVSHLKGIDLRKRPQEYWKVVWISKLFIVCYLCIDIFLINGYFHP